MFRALNTAGPRGGAAAGRVRPPTAALQRPGRPGPGRGAPGPGGGYVAGAPGPPGAGGRGGPPGRGRGRGRRVGPSPARPSAAFVVGPGRMLKAGFFSSDAIRQELQQRAYITQAQVGGAEPSCCNQEGAGWRRLARRPALSNSQRRLPALPCRHVLRCPGAPARACAHTLPPRSLSAPTAPT